MNSVVPATHIFSLSKEFPFSFQLGDIVHARVVAQSGPYRFIVQIGRYQLEVNTRLPLPIGQNVILEVVELYPRLHLRLLAEAGAGANPQLTHLLIQQMQLESHPLLQAFLQMALQWRIPLRRSHLSQLQEAWKNRFSHLKVSPRAFVLPYFIQWLQQDVPWQMPAQLLFWYWERYMKEADGQNSEREEEVWEQISEEFSSGESITPTQFLQKTLTPLLFSMPPTIAKYFLRQFQALLSSRWALIPIFLGNHQHLVVVQTKSSGQARRIRFHVDWNHPVWEWIHVEGEICFPSIDLNFYSPRQDFQEFVDSQKTYLAARLKGLKFERIQIRGWQEERIGRGLQLLVEQKVPKVNRVG